MHNEFDRLFYLIDMKNKNLTTVQKTMSSREIAELTRKRHDHVLRDCDNLNENYKKLGLPKVGEGYYTLPSTGSQRHRCYELTKIQTIDLMTGYNIELRIKINRRWEELERNNQFQVPTSMAEALRLAANQAEQIEQQEKELKAIAPKAKYYDEVMQSSSAINTNQIALELGITAIKLNNFLSERKIIYRQGDQWLLYGKYRNMGLHKMDTFKFLNRNDEIVTKTHLKWTEKGRKEIHKLYNAYLNKDN